MNSRRWLSLMLAGVLSVCTGVQAASTATMAAGLVVKLREPVQGQAAQVLNEV